jgi:hypothetical protein
MPGVPCPQGLYPYLPLRPLTDDALPGVHRVPLQVPPQRLGGSPRQHQRGPGRSVLLVLVVRLHYLHVVVPAERPGDVPDHLQ